MREASDHALKQLALRHCLARCDRRTGLMADYRPVRKSGCGGYAAPDGRLAGTDGSVRLADPAMFALLQVLKGCEGALCEVVEAERSSPRVWEDDFFDEGDPPSLDGVERARMAHPVR